MNIQLLQELCRRAIETNDPIDVSQVKDEITRILDAKRRELLLARRGLLYNKDRKFTSPMLARKQNA